LRNFNNALEITIAPILKSYLLQDPQFLTSRIETPSIQECL